MSQQYKTYTNLNLSQTAKDVQKKWDEENTFEQSIALREGKPPFVFYEGPPSANGLPGIHHVMARSIKDIFCRYKTQKGFQVKRKAGWDTHGLPIELSVEKALGITKEDIGKKITVEQYNMECRKDVMKYTDVWADVTAKMGYWVDMEHPYITYENKYIESVWWLLSKLYNKGAIYKGFTIQPYSPAAGTGLSSHELNQPGCYRDVKDRTATVMFKIAESEKHNLIRIVNNSNYAKEIWGENTLLLSELENIFFLAWTTTPWTLPSNTALAVGKNINYCVVKTYDPHTSLPITIIMADELRGKYFSIHVDFLENNADQNKAAFGVDLNTFELLSFESSKRSGAYWKVLTILKGSELEGIQYEQLLPFVQPNDGDAFKVILGDFVTTEDGTGIVHIAPSFGADDFRVAKQNGIGSLTLVDKRGKFLPEVKDGIFLYGEEYVKEAYLSEEEKAHEFQFQKKILEDNGKIKDLKAYLSVDERIVLKLQEEGKLFKKESYEHSYPHCWRTDKPILYYPLDSWFIKSTDYKERMIALNKTINWKPESTGTGRFGNWLENLNDWNLSRSRFWGIPIPIWTSEDKTEQLIIGSVAQLHTEIENAIAKGVMSENPLQSFKANDFSEANYASFDLHKPYADSIYLEHNGKKLFREPDLIDVWFDSGAMPFAQMHFPFENVKEFAKNYPADFIAEGVDQTRGWFFTLHAISAMLREEVQAELKAHGLEANNELYPGIAYKNVVSNGLVLDKNGQKMSKRLGNAIDPFTTIEKYGPDATRWYMITNAAPWDNLKFDLEGISEVQRKFFGTLHNTYSFFALYANVDNFNYSEAEVPLENRPEIDRWILSELNTLIKKVDAAYADYEPHRAGRLIESFVDEHLSNWYVRLCRRRFWKGDYSTDKIAAYQTLYRCLEVIAQLSAPIAPFFMDRLFNDLNAVTGRVNEASIHLSDFPKADEKLIDTQLEERMELAQKISSMVLSIRKKENIRVRQPLAKIQIPVLDESYKSKIEAVKDLILSEVNVKQLDLVNESQTQIVKNLKLNFKSLGKKCGKHMKAVQNFANENSAAIISGIEKNGTYEIPANVFANEVKQSVHNGEIASDSLAMTVVLETEDVEIIPVDIPGWKVANAGQLTVALDLLITPELREEGLARELVNRIQNLRKESNFALTDRIVLKIKEQKEINSAVNHNLEYICTEILANSIAFTSEDLDNTAILLELEENLSTMVQINKV